VEFGRSENLSFPLRSQNGDVIGEESVFQSEAVENKRVGLRLAIKQAIISFPSRLLSIHVPARNFGHSSCKDLDLENCFSIAPRSHQM
jgi:hypothetical protein